jgi:uncharacterized membrane protein
MTNAIALWFAETLGKYISAKAVVFIVSLMPILECRGGLIVAKLLGVNLLEAIPICVIGNLLPIPFILLFIEKIFKWMKQFAVFRPLVEKLEKRGMSRSSALEKGEFIGLLLFVGIPLPGTGGWTGSLAAALLDMDIKKASIAILLGVFLATVIMSIVSYGLLDLFI